jgi:hypothetical protein
VWCDVFHRSGVDGCVNITEPGNFTLSSEVGEFYLNIRHGYIVPFQNASEVKGSARGLANTTADLEKMEVDFLVLPQCDDFECKARGDYYNDDGDVNVTNWINQYEITFNQNVVLTPDTFTMYFNTIVAAGWGAIDRNDCLGGVSIYNAKHMGLTGNWTIEVLYDDGHRTTTDEGMYDPITDRLLIDVRE